MYINPSQEKRISQYEIMKLYTIDDLFRSLQSD